MATLNVSNLNHTGTLITNQLNTNNIKSHSGTSNLARFDAKVGTSLLTGITWGNADDVQTKLIGNITGANSAGCYAIVVSLWYQHNGSTNHGYLTGYFHQTDKDWAQDGTYFVQYHYDWYYNVTTTDYIVQWDPNGTQSLSLYNAYSHNSSTDNTFNFYHNGNLYAGA